MHIEDIYEALFDEEAFQQLPARFTEFLGAKSAVINWVHREGEVVNLAYYNFAPSMMTEYSANYVQKDPWVVAAMAPSLHNKIFNASDHVPETTFERSEIYNELIRPFHDDTYYCVGGAFVSDYGIGILGINRGRRATPFDETARQLLEGHAVALRRVLMMRGEIAAHRRNATLAKSVLDIVGLAAIVVNGDGRILYVNGAGEAILRRGDRLKSRNGHLVAVDGNANRLLAAAIAQTTLTGERKTGVVTLDRGLGVEPFRITMTPVNGVGRARTLVLFRDPDLREPSLAKRVSQTFHLTPAEAVLAVALSEGANLKEIAIRRGVRESTVRTQIKALAGKMNCRRQAEIAAMVAKIPPLLP